MKLEFKVFGCLCSMERFVINDINADEDDFGSKYDHDSDSAEPYGCGDMQFDKKPATKEILEKYNISLEEYDDICDKLSEGLSFGSCGWCV